MDVLDTQINAPPASLLRAYITTSLNTSNNSTTLTFTLPITPQHSFAAHECVGHTDQCTACIASACVHHDVLKHVKQQQRRRRASDDIDNDFDVDVVGVDVSGVNAYGEGGGGGGYTGYYRKNDESSGGDARYSCTCDNNRRWRRWGGENVDSRSVGGAAKRK
jgi:hypothetical protein